MRLDSTKSLQQTYGRSPVSVEFEDAVLTTLTSVYDGEANLDVETPFGKEARMLRACLELHALHKTISHCPNCLCVENDRRAVIVWSNLNLHTLALSQPRCVGPCIQERNDSQSSPCMLYDLPLLLLACTLCACLLYISGRYTKVIVSADAQTPYRGVMLQPIVMHPSSLHAKSAFGWARACPKQ